MEPGSLPGPVLVVDDDADLRDTIAEVVAESGRVVAIAEDGRDALAKLFDMMMPRMDCFAEPCPPSRRWSGAHAAPALPPLAEMPA